MKPYSRRNLEVDARIFNYRLSRARRVVENAFGILSNRWRCLLNTLQVRPQTAQHIVHACVCLHNLMRARYPAQQNALLDMEDQNHNFIPGAWREDEVMAGIRVQGGNFQTHSGNVQREYLKLYYNSRVGRVPWQERLIGEQPLDLDTDDEEDE